MSHQTGIQADDVLKKSFCKCRDGKTRILKISIIDEQLKLSKQLPVKGTWENDFDTYVPALVENGQPCFILYRLDTSNSLGNEWLLISWSPDSSPVRQKMLYASTKATLKQEFGSAHIKDEFHATVMEEATLKGYKGHLSGLSAPAPLTEREEALKELKINEHGANYSPNGRQTTMGGVAFPTTNEAKQKINDLKLGSYNYLQFKIDLEEEKIHIVIAAKIALSNLPEQVPSDEARYHLYIFSHTHEGDRMDSTVFIYSMPGYNCSIKERMLYSSCKGPFIDEIENSGLDISKKLEIDDGKDLTEEFLYEEIHPKRNLHRPAFAKPKGPPNRGARRMTKQQDAS